jgi:predicted MFS family arabinose efflux permease
VPAALSATRLLVNQPRRGRPPLDLAGSATATLGLFAVVYGFSNTQTHSWGHPVTIAMLGAGAVLLATFAAIEARAAHPLLPLQVLRDRTRAGAYLGLGLASVAMFAVFLFLTYYLQRTKGYSPITTGFAFLPLTAAVMTTAVAANVVVLRRVGPRALQTLGMLLGAGGMAGLAQLTPGSTYAADVLPPLLVLGCGLGNVFATTISTATHGVAEHDTGVASAMVNTMQQVGGSIGTALLSSIFAGAVSAYADGRRPSPRVLADAAVHGYTVAFWVAAGIFAGGALLVGSLMRGARLSPHALAEPVAT